MCVSKHITISNHYFRCLDKQPCESKTSIGIPPRIKPETRAMCPALESNRQPLGARDDAQPTESQTGQGVCLRFT